MIPGEASTVIDDVAVLRGPSPAPGRHAAGLVFRVGQFDETLPERGVTHMVEHLTLGGHHEAAYDFNASVDGRYTQFIVESSDPAGITAYLDAVCAGLAADHAAMLDRERRILRTEAASRGGAGMLGICLAGRYGARGPGLLHYEEYGFRQLTWEQITRWRTRWFTAANAVLWVAGDLPSGLRLPLPQGQRAPIPDTAQLPVTLPAYVTGANGGIAVSLVTGGAPADTATLTVLRRRLTQVLRHDHGLSYDVGVSMMDVDTSHAHAWLTADTLPEQVPMAAHVLLSAVEALASDGGQPGGTGGGLRHEPRPGWTGNLARPARSSDPRTSAGRAGRGQRAHSPVPHRGTPPGEPADRAPVPAGDPHRWLHRLGNHLGDLFGFRDRVLSRRGRRDHRRADGDQPRTAPSLMFAERLGHLFRTVRPKGCAPTRLPRSPQTRSLAWRCGYRTPETGGGVKAGLTGEARSVLPEHGQARRSTKQWYRLARCRCSRLRG